MERRDFLKLLTGGCATAMSAQVLSPLTARAADSETVDLTLTARPFQFIPCPGVTFQGLAFNGQEPGPLLRMRHGQRLRARFVNQTGTISTIHWHGMILPNEMDGVPDVTQKPVPNGGTFLYDFKPNPPGFHWYHSHVSPQIALGLIGAFIVESPRDEQADVEVVLVLHDVPDMNSFRKALAGVSEAPMIAPEGAPELASMGHMQDGQMAGAMAHGMAHAMGDEVAYLARCINGSAYPDTKPIVVKVGQRVRLRILNASPTLTHYVVLGGHRLRITHADGNLLPRAVEVDALRMGVAERYDAWFEVTRPGAWLLEAIAGDSLAIGQSVRIHTPGKEHAEPERPSESLKGLRYFTYQLAGDAVPSGPDLSLGRIDVRADFTLGHDMQDKSKWTINGKSWPNTPKILVHHGNRVLVHFRNPTNMDHPMHLHGHVFHLVEINGQRLSKPLPKDTTLVPANGGTSTWVFDATSAPGRWVLHCHNSVHLEDGMMTEVRYVGA